MSQNSNTSNSDGKKVKEYKHWSYKKSSASLSSRRPVAKLISVIKLEEGSTGSFE